jgi:hypothetical protein
MTRRRQYGAFTYIPVAPSLESRIIAAEEYCEKDGKKGKYSHNKEHVIVCEVGVDCDAVSLLALVCGEMEQKEQILVHQRNLGRIK